MADRCERIQIIQDTLQLCRENTQLKDAVQKSISTQKIYWEKDDFEVASARFKEPARLLMSGKRTMQAASGYANNTGKKICVLNFASAVTPGGGVLRGTTAQEESICRISTLYPALTDLDTAMPFYLKHREWIKSGTMNRKNNDDCIYTEGVITFREDTFDCEMLSEDEWFQTDVITCAAPDQRYDPNGNGYHPSETELQECFEQRIERILRIAAANQVDILILGAFGCGAFYNSPIVVSRAFENVIEKYRYHFEVIEFAVYTRDEETENYKAFAQIQGIRLADYFTADSKSGRGNVFYEAWWFLTYHPIFGDHFQKCLDIDLALVEPITRCVERNRSRNTKLEVWLECGPYEESGATHDTDLDCGGETFEMAICRLAKLVLDKYGDYDREYMDWIY